MYDLLHELQDAGLIQFGLFDGKPLTFNLNLLPSYPQLLAQIAESASLKMDITKYEHLVCTREALPFGVVLSQQTKVPLVYANPEEEGVMSLAGAYDVGHPALLLANTWLEVDDAQWILTRARRVGLEIDTVLMIIGANVTWDGLQLVSLLDMNELTEQLLQENRIPEGQADAVKRWLAHSTS